MKQRIQGRRATPDPAAAAAVLKRKTRQRPVLGLVLGSGFGATAQALDNVESLPYAALPGFPRPSVSGHAGKLMLGQLAETPVLVLSGRAHYYEGHSPDEVTFAMRVLAAFGVTDVLLTNAAGGVNARFRPGDFMLLRDHINFMGVNPLRGPAPPGRPRFVDLTQTYDASLSDLLRRAARAARLRLREGVYLAVSGPTYETPAEVRAFARWGADAVGMSTVPEAIVARQCGLRVAGVSCITNLAAGRSPQPLSHAEVLVIAERGAQRAVALLKNFARLYGKK
ncbi:MAG TPA: purine-nucleoside phosphorylase [Verrucomicrobiota bacterium]|nr:purine-nucleoside phosphorylase [Verrucomicrobiota bacterium]HQB16344.1 purine-nucleoside phosphorylase [Verrucomicrobiota bacterium]